MANTSNSLRLAVVMATSAAAIVKVTHKAWMVQTFRKRIKEGLISSKRSSLPCFLDAAEQERAQADGPDDDQRP